VPVTVATVIEVVGIVTIMSFGIFLLDSVGVVAAATALLVGRLGANFFLAPVLRRPTS
jgi:hypothetical protein